MQLQETNVPSLPEGLQAVVNYSQALANPVPLLQAELQPVSASIGQVCHAPLEPLNPIP